MDKGRGGASMNIIEVSHLVKEYKKIKKESLVDSNVGIKFNFILLYL